IPKCSWSWVKRLRITEIKGAHRKCAPFDSGELQLGLLVHHGLALCTKSSAISGNHWPAAGSMMPHSGSTVEPPGPRPRVHSPSDSPGILIHRYASMSVFPVLAVGRKPTPRSGGLHQSCGSG